jgi:hypothetical protein
VCRLERTCTNTRYEQEEDRTRTRTRTRTRHDTTQSDTTRHNPTRHDTTRHDTTKQDTTRHDTTWHGDDKARQDKTKTRHRQDQAKTRQGKDKTRQRQDKAKTRQDRSSKTALRICEDVLYRYRLLCCLHSWNHKYFTVLKPPFQVPFVLRSSSPHTPQDQKLQTVLCVEAKMFKTVLR